MDQHPALLPLREPLRSRSELAEPNEGKSERSASPNLKLRERQPARN